MALVAVVLAVLCLLQGHLISWARGQQLGLPTTLLHHPPSSSSSSSGTVLGAINPHGNLGLLSDRMLQQQQLQLQQHPQNVMTCINSDPQDASSVIRLTITGLDNPGERQQGMFHGQSPGDSDRPRDWQINGYYIPRTVNPLSGSFQVVVTQYGRVNDGCNAAAMGQAVDTTPRSAPFQPAAHILHPFTNVGAAGSGAGTGMGAGVGGGRRRAGHLTNPLLVTKGGMTMYSSVIRGVSRGQLLGGGVAVCPRADDEGQCYGAVLQCCTIAKDQLHATQVFLNPSAAGQLQQQPSGDDGSGLLQLANNHHHHHNPADPFTFSLNTLHSPESVPLMGGGGGGGALLTSVGFQHDFPGDIFGGLGEGSGSLASPSSVHAAAPRQSASEWDTSDLSSSSLLSSSSSSDGNDSESAHIF